MHAVYDNVCSVSARSPQAHRLCVAPMMDWTDRHCRYFHRLLAPSALLYTEMLTTGAILNGDRGRLLAHNPEEHPVALQLGGSEPGDLARCARIVAAAGFDEINLNVGCPSDRVQQGRFGACLMREPVLVRDCLAALRAAVDLPITIKTRLGVDELYSYGYFRDFVGTVVESGVSTVVVHARMAHLAGLSPKENREVPPLHHDWVYRLKQERPELTIILNGGVTSAAENRMHLTQVDGVMLGRAAYHTPWVLAECQQLAFGAGAPASPAELLAPMADYLADQVAAGEPVARVTRHVLGLFQGQPGARAWRRYLSEHAAREPANAGILADAYAAMQQRSAPQQRSTWATTRGDASGASLPEQKALDHQLSS